MSFSEAMSRLLFFTKTFRFFLFLSGYKRGAAARILPNTPPPILRRTPEILPNRLSRVPCLVGVENLADGETQKKTEFFTPGHGREQSNGDARVGFQLPTIRPNCFGNHSPLPSQKTFPISSSLFPIGTGRIGVLLASAHAIPRGVKSELWERNIVRKSAG